MILPSKLPVCSELCVHKEISGLLHCFLNKLAKKHTANFCCQPDMSCPLALSISSSPQSPSPLALNISCTPPRPQSPLALSISCTPPQSPSPLHPPTFSFTSIPLPKSPGLQRTVSLTPASPCEAMPPRAMPSRLTSLSVGNVVKPKSKPKLGKGCSLLDWVRLCRSKKEEFCCNGGKPRNVTEGELSRHNTKEDAWTAIRGKVYNITPYMKFHPGGVDDLMKAAGKDSTILFDEAHKWVNIDSMLKFCFVGPLTPNSPETVRRNSLKIAEAGARLRSSSLTSSSSSNYKATLLRSATQAAVASEEPAVVRQDSPESPVKLFAPPIHKTSPLAEERQDAEESPSILSVPEGRTRKNSDVTKPYPRFDWIESEKAIIIRVVTQCPSIKKSDVIIDLNGKEFEASIFMNDWIFDLHIELEKSVTSSQVTVIGSRVEISLKKQDTKELWNSIGVFKPGHLNICSKSSRETKYHPTTVEAITTVTHDSKVFTLRLPTGSYLNVPTGHHLTVRADVDGETVTRQYTPICSSEDLSRHTSPAHTEGQSIDLMIKLYSDGKMSQFLSNLSIGDEVWVSDPEGTFSADRITDSNLLLIAAGSGFTPMVKVLRDFLHSELSSREEESVDCPGILISSSEEPREHKQCEARTAKLLFANKTEEDIWWREELGQLTKTDSKRFEVLHVLSNTKDGTDEVKGQVKGRINGSLLKNYLPTDKDQCNKTLVCICGPCQFTAAISNVLLDEDYPIECIHCFT